MSWRWQVDCGWVWMTVVNHWDEFIPERASGRTWEVSGGSHSDGVVVTVGLIVRLLAVDLALGALRPHAVGFREATVWSVFYIAVAVAFGLVLGWIAGLGVWYAVLRRLSGRKEPVGRQLVRLRHHQTTFAGPERHQQKAVILVITAVASLAKVRRDPTARAHAGSVSAHGRKPESESARWSS